MSVRHPSSPTLASRCHVKLPAAVMSSNDSTSDPSPSLSAPDSDESSQKTDRTPLIQKAQAFLLSPSIRHADGASKRKFLHEKGLTQEEVDVLMHTLVRPR